MSSGFWKPAPISQSDATTFGDADQYNDNDYIPTAAFMHSNAPLVQQQRLLPIYKHRRQIAYAVEEYSVVVIVGETGSGKSTQIPQYLVEYGWANNDFCVVCTQPRRIAATTLAKRVATEMGTPLGQRVGYAVRFDEQSSPLTQIKYVTEGILLREATVHDPLLSQYSVVICDEVQERNMDSDILLGLLRKIRRIRKELRIIVCSATADAQKFLDFFVDSDTEDKDDTKSTKRETFGNQQSNQQIGEQGAQIAVEKIPKKGTIISVDGRQFPVDVFYLPKPAPNYITSTVHTCWNVHKEEHGGDVLCFLPTAEDIDNTMSLCEDQFQSELHNIELLPLYGSLPYRMQALVFQDAAVNKDGKSKRRIVFATNIAETSVTIPNISFVIDSGFVNQPFFDPNTALERLIISPISQSSARQRAGRAGRVQSGKCFRLYTENDMLNSMREQNVPEILRSNLTNFVLTLKALGVDNLLTFDLIDPPSTDSLIHALDCLYALDAIDGQSNLTPLGLNMSVFPTDARVAKMLLNSFELNCSWEVLTLASTMQVRDLFIRPKSNQPAQMQRFRTATANMADSSGDHVSYINLISEMDEVHYDEQYCQENFINLVAVKKALEVRSQLARFLRRFGKLDSLGPSVSEAERSSTIRRCLTAGFFFNVAKLGSDGRYYTLRHQIPVTPSSTSMYGIHSRVSSEYIIYNETMDGSRGGIELRTVSAIEARWLHELAPHYWK